MDAEGFSCFDHVTTEEIKGFMVGAVLLQMQTGNKSGHGDAELLLHSDG